MEIQYSILHNTFNDKIKKYIFRLIIPILLMSALNMVYNSYIGSIAINNFVFLLLSTLGQLLSVFLLSLSIVMVIYLIRGIKIDKSIVTVILRKFVYILAVIFVVTSIKSLLLYTIAVLLSLIPFMSIFYDFILYAFEIISLALSINIILLFVDGYDNLIYVLIRSVAQVKQQLLLVMTCGLPYILFSVFLSVGMIMASVSLFEGTNLSGVSEVLSYIFKSGVFNSSNLILLIVYFVGLIISACLSLYLISGISCIYNIYNEELIKEYNKR